MHDLRQGLRQAADAAVAFDVAVVVVVGLEVVDVDINHRLACRWLKPLTD